MNKVEPIKSIQEITSMYRVLKIKSQRDYLLFKIAIHTGMKLCDLLNLTVNQIKQLSDNPHLINEKMSECELVIKIKLPEDLKREVKDYIHDQHLQEEDLLFQSSRTQRGLSRQQAYRIIHQAAEEAGVEHVGLTTLRKTFAFHAYQAGFPVSIIQKYLGHQSTLETLKFIGLSHKSEHHTYIALNL